MKQESRKKIQVRMNRIAGQVGGIARMIEEDKYCVDILTQIAAVRSALDSLGVELLTEHIESCVIGHGTDSAHECAKPLSQEQLLAELQIVLGRFLQVKGSRPMVTTVVQVEEVGSDARADEIKRIVGMVPGVSSVAVDVRERTVAVRHDEQAVARADISLALSRAGVQMVPDDDLVGAGVK